MAHMGINIKESEKLDKFLADTSLAAENAKLEFLKESSKIAKAAVLKHIPRTMGVRRHTHRKPMHKDVQAGLAPDKKFGGKRMRVRGGRQTGRLWHILNDGAHRRNQPTHFIDKAMRDIEGDIDALLDKTLRGEFKM